MKVVRRYIIQSTWLWCETCPPNSLDEQMGYTIYIEFKATNNEAEYEALLTGLRVATELEVEALDAFSDSQLVINQVQGDYLAKISGW